MQGRTSRNMKNICDFDQSLIRNYDLIKKIGKGAYGTVWKAHHRLVNRTVAIKKIENAFENDVDARRTFREINYLSIFKGHPNIIRLLTLHRASNNHDIYIIFEYMDIDLHAYMKKGYDLQDSQIRYITYQVASALKYLHSANVVHRDLKPANILLNSKCQAKIADFGLARTLNSILNEPAPLTEYIATRWYRPPEVLLNTKNYSTAVDMWSLGCILAEMYRSVPLFPGTTTLHQIEIILSSVPKVLLTEDDGIDYKPQSFYTNSSNDDPVKLDECLISVQEPEARDLIKQLLCLSPKKRISAEESLQHDYLIRHTTNSEPKMPHPPTLPLGDGVLHSVQEYRNAIYKAIENGKRSSYFEKHNIQQKYYNQMQGTFQKRMQYSKSKIANSNQVKNPLTKKLYNIKPNAKTTVDQQS